MKVSSSRQTRVIAVRGQRTITFSMQEFCMKLVTIITAVATYNSQLILTHKTGNCVVKTKLAVMAAIAMIRPIQQAQA